MKRKEKKRDEEEGEEEREKEEYESKKAEPYCISETLLILVIDPYCLRV